ncbi:MAG: DUF6089 family protein [Flavobacteriaceae bacterium]
MKNFLFLLILLFSIKISSAQVNELGFHIGGSNYIGDVGDETYLLPNKLSLGAIYKWNFSNRIALRLSGSYIQLSDNDEKSKNAIRNARGFSFSNSVREMALGIEFAYYDYSLMKEGWSSTPYIILEVAGFNYHTVDKETTPGNYETVTSTGFTVPFGIGYKTKIANHIGLNFETIVRYSFVDDLDYNNPAISSLNFGNPNTKDWYITSGVNIVFGFGRRSCYSDVF